MADAGLFAKVLFAKVLFAKVGRSEASAGSNDCGALVIAGIGTCDKQQSGHGQCQRWT